MRNPCKECDYYRKENNTCQSKKCSPRGGDGTVTWMDRLFCKPYKYEADRKTEPTGYNLSPVDKDINVRSNSSEIPTGSTISKMEQVDEPQKERSNEK